MGKKIMTFVVNGDKEVPGILFGENIETSLEQLQLNLENKLNELRTEGFNIISIIPENLYGGGGNIAIYVVSYKILIIAEI
jgi:hypothetical protein